MACNAPEGKRATQPITQSPRAMSVPFRTALMTLLLIPALAACRVQSNQACDRICENLVRECDFAAFPNLESCVQGCRNDVELGAQVLTLEACVQDARCDPFTVLRCDLVFGEED